MTEEKRHVPDIAMEPDTVNNSSKHFFISYSSADEDWAEWIAWQLEEVGFTTILQAWDFRPGANFVLKMQKASEEAERVIAVLSPDYLSSPYTQPEWSAAFKRDPKGIQGILIPVIVRECKQELLGMWSPIVNINLVGLDELLGRKTLLEGTNLGRNKPITAPGFPGAVQHKETEEPYFPGTSTNETHSSEKTAKVVNSSSITQQINSPNTVLGSSENVLKPEPTPLVNAITKTQQPDTIHAGSNQPSQTTIASVPPNSSSLQPFKLSTSNEEVQKPVEWSERLINYRNKLAKMEVTLDLGDSLSVDFAGELQQLLGEAIRTIRTTPHNTSPLTSVSYFKSRGAVLENLQKAHIQIRLAFDALSPFLFTSFFKSRTTEGFYQHLSDCRNFLEQALENW